MFQKKKLLSNAAQMRLLNFVYLKFMSKVVE